MECGMFSMVMDCLAEVWIISLLSLTLLIILKIFIITFEDLYFTFQSVWQINEASDIWLKIKMHHLELYQAL